MILSAQIRNEKYQLVGTFALKRRLSRCDQVVWYGHANLELHGDRYRAECQLVLIDEPDDKGEEGE